MYFRDPQLPSAINVPSHFKCSTTIPVSTIVTVNNKHQPSSNKPIMYFIKNFIFYYYPNKYKRQNGQHFELTTCILLNLGTCTAYTLLTTYFVQIV